MKFAALVVAAACLVSGCSDARAPLVASDVVINRPLPGMQMSAGYLTLTNNADEPVTITHVTSPQFGAVELHETIIEDGVSRMVRLGEVTIPPSTSVVFEPGGKHLMLMRPGDDLQEVSLVIHSHDTALLTISVSPAG